MSNPFDQFDAPKGVRLNVSERAMRSDIGAQNLDGASGDLHAEPTPEEVAHRGQRNLDAIRRELGRTSDPSLRKVLMDELKSNASDFGDGASAPVTVAPAGNPFDKFDGQQPETDTPIADAAKSVASGALSGVGSIVQGGEELLARGVNAVTGTDTMRASNPFQGAIDWLNKSQSDVTKRKVADSQISGSVLQPSTWDFGKDPNVRGLAMQGINAIGQFAPNLATALLTGGASIPVQLGVGAVVGGLQGLGAASGEERDKFMAMSDDELSKSSKLYVELVGKGVSRDQAKKAVAEAAALGGGIGNAIPSAAEQAFEDFLVGALSRGRVKLPKLGLGVAGKAVSGGVGGAALGGVEEAGEQMSQNVGSNIAVSGNRPFDADTLQQFVMGAIAEGAAGVAVSPLSKGREEKPQPEAKPMPLDFGDGRIVRDALELERIFAPMATNEREDALKQALERSHGYPLSEEESQAISDVFAHVEPSKQGQVIGEQIFGEPQEAAGATPQEEAPPVAPAAPVPAKAIVRSAKKRLDELHKQAIEADPQLSHIDGEGKAVFTPGNSMHLTPAQEQEYEFLKANMENPEALAKRYGVTLAPESPTKVAKDQKLQEGGAAVDTAVRAAKGKSSLGDTIERGQQQAEKEISTARQAQAVEQPKAQPEPKPAPSVAGKIPEGDIKSLVGKRAPAASSAVAGTVAKAAAVLDEEQAKTEAHKVAVEKSKKIEAERAAKTSAKTSAAAASKVEVKPAPAQKKEPAKTSAEKPSKEVSKKAAPRQAKEVAKEVAKPVVGTTTPKTSTPKKGVIAPKLGAKGEAAVAKSKVSAAEKALISEVRSVLKKYPGTKTPVAYVQKELGVPHDVAKELVARARGEKVETDFARKHLRGEPTNERRVSIGLGAGEGSPMAARLGSREIPVTVAKKAIRAAIDAIGVRLVGEQTGVGAYMEGQETSVQVDAHSTEDQIDQMMAMVGYALQQTSVISARLAHDGKNSALDLFFVSLTAGQARTFFDRFLALQREAGKVTVPGYQQAVTYGKQSLRFINFDGLWTAAEADAIISLLKRAADETGLEIADAAESTVELRQVQNDWSKHPDGSGYSRAFNDAGGVQGVWRSLDGWASPSRHAQEVAGGDFAHKSPAAAVGVQSDSGRGRGLAELDREAQLAQAELAHVLADKFGGEAEARKVLDVVVAHSPEGDIASAVAARFGFKLHFFSNKAPNVFDFDGVAPAGSKSIFVNENNERPLMAIAGHELLHKLRQTDELAYQSLVQAVQDYYSEKGRSVHARNLRASLEDGKVLSETKYEEEFLADAVGDLFLDPHFWDEFGKREPSLFRTVLGHIFKILDSVLDFLAPSAAAGNTYFTDLNRAREAVADSFSRWLRSQPEYKETTRSNAFASWFGQSKVVEEGTGVPRVMYHGTARTFKVFRGKQANAMFFSPMPTFAEVFAQGSMNYVNHKQEAIKRGHETFDAVESRELADAAPLIYPVFVKAENPFDFDNPQHIAGLRAWLNARFKTDEEYRVGQRLLGVDDVDVSFTPTKEDLIEAVGSGSWAAVENVLTQRYIKMHEHDGFYMMEERSKNLAVYSPTQVKSIFNDNFDASSPDFARKPTAKQRLAAGQITNTLISQAGQAVMNNPAKRKKLELTLGTKALALVDRWVGDRMSPLGHLPDIESYLTSRSVTMGVNAAAQEESRAIYDVLGKASDKVAAEVFTYWTNAYSPSAAISDPEIRAEAVRIKDRITEIGEKLVKRGMLDSKTYQTNKGRYVPRLYLKHVLDEAGFRGVGAGKGLSDLGYAKNRKDIPENIRRAILGEIRDPAFLGSVAVGKPLRDMAILDFLETISKNENWVWRPSIVAHKGQQVSVAWVRNEIDRLREQITYYKDPAVITEAKNEVAALEQTLQAAQQAAGGKVAGDDYTSIPDTPRYGLLRGLYVRKEIHDDLVGSAHVQPSDWAENLLGYGGIGTRVTQAWKASKVSLNPPAQIRNFISNFMLLHLSGVAMHRLPMRLAQALTSIIKKDKYHDLALKYGVTVGTFSAQELYHIRDEFLKDEGKGGPLAFLRYARIIANKAGDAYQFMETIGKVAKMIDEIETYGAHETAAALEANKWLFDYSLVPKSVRWLRNAPLGMPFLTFYYKLAPRLLEVALKYPWRFAPYVGAAYLIPQLIAGMGGPGPDDQEKLKKALAEWLRNKQHVYVLPERDSNGNWTFLDLSYLVPFTMFTDAARQVKNGQISELIKTAGLFSGPFPDLVTAIKSGKDSFTGRDIANPGDPTSLKIGAWLTYLYNMAMPPIITNHNLIGPDLGDPSHVVGGRLPSALFGTTNKYGDPRNTVTQALLGAMGLNIYPVNPEHTRLGEMSRMLFEIHETQRILKQKMSDQGLSDEQRQDLAARYVAEMQRRIAKLQEFAAESELPANLTK